MVVSFYQSISVSSSQQPPVSDIWVAAVIRNIAKTTTSCQFNSGSNHQGEEKKIKIKNSSTLENTGSIDNRLPIDPGPSNFQTTPGRRMGLTISACVWFLIDPLRLSPSELLITDHSLQKMMETHIREITRILTAEILDGWWISDDQDTKRSETMRILFYSFMMRIMRPFRGVYDGVWERPVWRLQSISHPRSGNKNVIWVRAL